MCIGVVKCAQNHKGARLRTRTGLSLPCCPDTSKNLTTIVSSLHQRKSKYLSSVLFSDYRTAIFSPMRSERLQATTPARARGHGPGQVRSAAMNTPLPRDSLQREEYRRACIGAACLQCWSMLCTAVLFTCLSTRTYHVPRTGRGAHRRLQLVHTHTNTFSSFGTPVSP